VEVERGEREASMETEHSIVIDRLTSLSRPLQTQKKKLLSGSPLRRRGGRPLEARRRRQRRPGADAARRQARDAARTRG